jgi:hypothetical protein
MAIRTVNGEVEAVGQHYLNGPMGMSFTFVRIGGPDGKLVSLENVATDNEVGSYMKTGAAGRFCFYPYQKANVLCGYSSPSRTEIVDRKKDPIVMQANAHRARGWGYIWVGVLISLAIFSLTLFGAPVLLPAVGAMIFGAPFIFSGWLSLLNYPNPKRPSTDEISRALKAA